jgi:uncharacterized metal-binding protein
MKKIAEVQKLSKTASIVSQKLDNRMEKILEAAEELVKEAFPARYVSASLTRLKKTLYKEGIECAFDYKITRKAIRKTANSDVTKEECDEAIAKIAEAVVDEVEETLDQCNTAIDEIAKQNFGKTEAAAKNIKRRVQARMNRKGLHLKF